MHVIVCCVQFPVRRADARAPGARRAVLRRRLPATLRAARRRARTPGNVSATALPSPLNPLAHARTHSLLNCNVTASVASTYVIYFPLLNRNPHSLAGRCNVLIYEYCRQPSVTCRLWCEGSEESTRQRPHYAWVHGFLANGKSFARSEPA